MFVLCRIWVYLVCLKCVTFKDILPDMESEEWLLGELPGWTVKTNENISVIKLALKTVICGAVMSCLERTEFPSLQPILPP